MSYANYESCYQDAIEMVSSWDLPVEDLPAAVRQQAELMAGGFDGFGIKEPPDISPYRPLRFI